MKKNLKSALWKVKPFLLDVTFNKNALKIMRKLEKDFDPNRTEYSGYLTPMEILSLMKLGVSVNDGSKWTIEYATAKKKKGECNPQWFYFYGNKDFKKLYDRVKNETK